MDIKLFLLILGLAIFSWRVYENVHSPYVAPDNSKVTKDVIGVILAVVFLVISCS
jgi:hypothetical protein